MKYPITQKYRTQCSIADCDVDSIIKHFSSLPNPYVFLDLGCHFGHLSIEMALRYHILIYAVDNFKGSPADPVMDKIILDLAGGPDFFIRLSQNIAENSTDFKGLIVPCYINDFLKNIPEIDFCFTDATHNEMEAGYIRQIAEKIVPNGILAGHDYGSIPIQTVVTEILQEGKFELVELLNNMSWFLRKKA